MTAERRKKKFTNRGGMSFEWFCPKGRRNEVFDVEVLNLVAIRLLQQKFNVNLELLQTLNTNGQPATFIPPSEAVGQISDGITL